MAKERAHYCLTFLSFLLILSLSLLCHPAAQGGEVPSPSPALPAAAPVTSPSTGIPAASPAPQLSPPPSPSPEASPVITPGPGEAGKSLSLEAVLQKMKEANAGLKDYSSPIRITGLASYSIIDTALYIEGTYYFKTPDKHRLKISKGPHYLAQYPQAFGWSLPDPREWTGKVKEVNENGKDYFLVKLIPVMGQGDLLKNELWVDKKSYLFSRQVSYYRDKGMMTIESSYRVVEGFHVFDKLIGHFEFPKKHLKGKAQAEYGEYRINGGIDDAVFQDEKKK
ncbi:MAG: hypothetical protein RDV48_05395 [Candidatus Eremiobacteraeota bacterium]|nr:hypothetical protein [Candidatus Eremiobacteraeota bacterium]